MKQIQLTQGKVAVVDDCDFNSLSEHNWYATRWGHTYYAVRSVSVNGTPTQEYMHRVVTGAAKGAKVDHRDGNGLNNQRSNLRVCTQGQNVCNRRKQAGTTSSFKGVSWHGPSKRWRATIGHDGRQTHLGLFVTEKAAARAYDTAASNYFGEFARLNFSIAEEGHE